jgi:hypothetical protein
LFARHFGVILRAIGEGGGEPRRHHISEMEEQGMAMFAACPPFGGGAVFYHYMVFVPILLAAGAEVGAEAGEIPVVLGYVYNVVLAPGCGRNTELRAAYVGDGFHAGTPTGTSFMP